MEKDSPRYQKTKEIYEITHGNEKDNVTVFCKVNTVGYMAPNLK